MVEIVFLGTGGGRFNLIAQRRGTGGFRINGLINFHVDPGPGALIACKKFRQDPRKVDVLVVSHNHVDHTTDSGAMVEAMTLHHWKPKGMAIGSKSAMQGDSHGDRGISHYHLKRLQSAQIAIPGKAITLHKDGKKAKLIPTRTQHEDKTGIGFVLEMEGKRIGYTSDTEYFEGISAQYKGCDALIINNLKREKDGVPGHLSSLDTIRILREAKPKAAYLTHMGLTLLKYGPEKEARRIEKESGVRTVAAKDGMRVTV